MTKFWEKAVLAAVVIVGMLWAAPSMATEGKAASGPFDNLVHNLVKDGFDADFVAAIYGDSKVSLDLSVATGYFRHRESKVNYGQFLEPAALAGAREYLAGHAGPLQAAEQAYGVDKEVITAILLVETRLGDYTGNKLVVNTLSTLAALADKKNQDLLYEKVRKGGDATRREVDAWAAKKARWAYQELKAYLQYTGQAKMDPLGIQGSFAGALGFSQFMPSNILVYGADGNNDGAIDLFVHDDAIASIARYLHLHGWKPGMDEKSMAKVLLTYNNSAYYADTLMQIRSALRK